MTTLEANKEERPNQHREAVFYEKSHYVNKPVWLLSVVWENNTGGSSSDIKARLEIPDGIDARGWATLIAQTKTWEEEGVLPESAIPYPA